MSVVKLVENKKATVANGGNPVWYTKSTSGKAFRVQVSSVNETEVSPGLWVRQNRTGFATFLNEDMAKNFVAKALSAGGVLPGKVIYVDSTTPIMSEAPGYGLQYPYPVNFNKQKVESDVSLKVQMKAVQDHVHYKTAVPDANGEAVLKDIYRSKMYTEMVNASDVILPIDNHQDVNAFIATVLENEGVDPAVEAQREARLAELLSIPSAKRSKEQKAELIELSR